MTTRRRLLKLSLAAPFAVCRPAVGATGVVVKPERWPNLRFLGSIHLLKRSDVPLPASYYESINWAEQVFFEISPIELRSRAGLRTFQDAAYGQEGTLRSAIGPELFRKIMGFADVQRMSIRDLVRARPWWAAHLLRRAALNGAGYYDQYGVESALQSFLGSRRPVGGLSSLNEHLTAMGAHTPHEEQIATIVKSLGTLQAAAAECNEVATAWRRGGQPMQHAVPEAVIRQNHQWAPTIELLAKESKRTAIVVGFAHLIGEKSLMNAIR